MSEEIKSEFVAHTERVNKFVAELVSEFVPVIRQRVGDFLEQEVNEHGITDAVGPANFAVAAISSGILAEHFADFSAQGAFPKEDATGRYFEEFKSLYTAFFEQRYLIFKKIGEESGDALP